MHWICDTVHLKNISLKTVLSYRIAENALLANADEYALSSFRREVPISRAANEHEAFDQLWQDELNLTTHVLSEITKTNPACQLRIWLRGDDTISDKVSRSIWDSVIEQGEELTRLMISKDCRNFHGWADSMRMRTLTAARTPNEKHSLGRDDLEIVDWKINDDFANYSSLE